jgi:hypothetical protein
MTPKGFADLNFTWPSIAVYMALGEIAETT